MTKIAALLPLPIVLGLYACAAAGTTDDDLDNPVLPPIVDASSDATTRRPDSGPASPPREAGASSSGDAGRRDSGASSSSGGSSSSSSSSGGGGGPAPECSGVLKALLVGIDLLGGGGASFAAPVDSCNDCDPGGGLNCCYAVSGQDFCVDIAGATNP